MSEIINTFSSNSLKILDKDIEEFKNKYIYNLSLLKKDERAIIGQKFHNLICMYLKNYDTDKLVLDLSEEEKNIWDKLKILLSDKKEDFIKLEYPFLIKEKLFDKFYYLTGRFDAIYRENENYTIYDWKTLNIPQEADNDIQSIVYLYSASVIFNSTKIKMRYFSLEKQEYTDIDFVNLKIYKDKIEKIIAKLY